MRCEACNQEADSRFRCSYCNRYFCQSHWLPENHQCPDLDKKLQRIKEQEAARTRISESEPMKEELVLATMPAIPKYEVDEVLGVVYGSSTRTRGLGGRFVSGLEAIAGGKGTAYAEEIEKARKEALEDLKNQARKLGANGVLSIDFETSEVLEGFILVSAYGTAVRLKISAR